MFFPCLFIFSYMLEFSKSQTTPPEQMLFVSGRLQETGNRLPNNWRRPAMGVCSELVSVVGYPGILRKSKLFFFCSFFYLFLNDELVSLSRYFATIERSMKRYCQTVFSFLLSLNDRMRSLS